MPSFLALSMSLLICSFLASVCSSITRRFVGSWLDCPFPLYSVNKLKLIPVAGNLLGGVIYLNHNLAVTEPAAITSKDKAADGAYYDLDNIDKYVFGYSDDGKDILGFYEYTQAWLANNKAYLKLNGAPVKGAIRIDLGNLYNSQQCVLQS